MTVQLMQEEVNQRLFAVQDLIASLDQQRVKLSGDATKLKWQVSEAVQQLVNSLRKREQLLLRQIEIVSTHQSSLMRDQDGELLQCEGALEATKDLLTRCIQEDTSTLAKVNLPNIPQIGSDRLLKPIMVQIDSKVLSSSISEFGTVHLPDQISQNSSSHILPTRVEEYGDADHDIMHKSVSPNMDSNAAILVRVPRLPKEAWLSKNSVSKKQQISGSIPMQDQTNNLTNLWVSNLHLHEETNNDEASSTISSLDDALKEYSVIGSNSGQESTRTSTSSSSIEVISRAISGKGCYCSDSLNSLCEIENLDKAIVDKSLWLMPPSPMKVSVESACRANECCKSFDDCVCEGTCKKIALQKQQQTINWRVHHERKRRLSDSENHIDDSLLIAKDNCSILNRHLKVSGECDWLKKSSSNASTTDCQENDMDIQENADYNLWLRKASKKGSPIHSKFPRKELFSEDQSIQSDLNAIGKHDPRLWLNRSNCLNYDILMKPKSLKSQFEDIKSSGKEQWLKKKKKKAAAKEVIVRQNLMSLESSSDSLNAFEYIDMRNWLSKTSNLSLKMPRLGEQECINEYLHNLKQADKKHWVDQCLSMEFSHDLSKPDCLETNILKEFEKISKLDKNNWLKMSESNDTEMKAEKLKIEIEGEKERKSIGVEDLSSALRRISLVKGKRNAGDYNYWLSPMNKNDWLNKGFLTKQKQFDLSKCNNMFVD